MPSVKDGPGSPLFVPLPFKGNVALSHLPGAGISDEMSAALEQAPSGACVAWGISFEIGGVVVIKDEVVEVAVSPTVAPFLVFMHTMDLWPIEPPVGEFISPMRGEGRLAEHAADYVMLYGDGTEVRVPIQGRYQIGTFQRHWGENCFEAVAHRKPHPQLASHEPMVDGWGRSQTRLSAADKGTWVNWLWAWENPCPDKAVVGIRFEPVSGIVVISAISGGKASSLPLRWRTRRKAVLKLSQGERFLPELDEQGLLKQIQLDMGQIISATSRLLYPNDSWTKTYNNQIPEMSENELVIEYTSHPDANFYLAPDQVIPVAQVEAGQSTAPLRWVQPATQRVALRTVDRESGKGVSVKLHVHGEWGEYLAPIDRHRILNPEWFEDYSVDFPHLNT
ncbi:MAG: hypothetical protein JSW15_03735, partial [Deltaproteobacteria bacterium]